MLTYTWHTRTRTHTHTHTQASVHASFIQIFIEHLLCSYVQGSFLHWGLQQRALVEPAFSGESACRVTQRHTHTPALTSLIPDSDPLSPQVSGHLVEMTKRQASPHLPPLAPSCPARQGPSTPSWPRDHWGLRGETQPPTSSAAPLLAPCPSSGRTPFFNKGKARSSHPSCSSLPPPTSVSAHLPWIESPACSPDPSGSPQLVVRILDCEF